MAEWLLVETFGGVEPSLIGIGRSPKPFVPLRKVLRNPRSLAMAAGIVDEVCATRSCIDRASDSGERRVLARPLLLDAGRPHGVYLWIGRADEQAPPRDPAGAWCWNLSTSRSCRSEDLLDLYGVAPPNRSAQLAIAGAFTRLVANRDEGEVLAKVVRSAPGTEHQAVWTVRRDDNALRAAHFACRIVAEKRPDGGEDILLRGITHDIGAAEETPAAPAPVILEYTLLAAATEVGEYRAIVNLRNLNLIRWVGEPMPGIAWQLLPGEPTPEIHPGDLRRARGMSRELQQARTRGVVRVRSVDGGWRPLDVRASLMALDERTEAALVTVTVADTADLAPV